MTFADVFHMPDKKGQLFKKRWQMIFEEMAYQQKGQLVLWIPVFFAIGIGLYFSLRFEPSFIIAFPLAILSITASGLLYGGRLQSFMRYAIWVTSFAAALVASGFATAQYRTMMLDYPMLTTETGPVAVQGRVADIDRFEEGAGYRLILDDLDMEDMHPDDTPRKVRIKVRNGQDIKIGQRVEILAGLNPPSAPVEPRAFDFQRYAYFKQIGGFGFAYRDPVILENAQNRKRLTLQNRLESIRQYYLGVIGPQIDPPSRGVAEALMTGERTAIPEEIWDAMRDSGMAHMLAISGLHVGMVAGVIFFFSRLLMAAFPNFALRHPIKKYAAVIAMLGALFYMLIVGSTIPTQRAMLMTAIVMLAVIMDRKAISLRLVAIAAFAVLVFTPEALWSASFQMSFAAVTALVYFYDIIRPLWSKMHRNASWLRRIGLYIMGVSMTTVIATLATAPFALFHFQQLSIYSLFANLVGVPVMAFIVMPATAFSYPAILVGIEYPFLWLMEQGISFILFIAMHVATLEGATWNPAAWPAAALFSVVSAVLLLILIKGRGKVIAAFPFALGMLLLFQHNPPDILISSSGKLVAYREGNGEMVFSSRASDRFSSDIWMRRNGQEDKRRWPYEAEKEEGAMHCDAFGCHLELKGHMLAFSKHPQSHSVDCDSADILIAQDPVFNKPCAAKQVIDYFDLWRNGAHALWLGSGKIETVASVRGERPWTISPRR